MSVSGTKMPPYGPKCPDASGRDERSILGAPVAGMLPPPLDRRGGVARRLERASLLVLSAIPASFGGAPLQQVAPAQPPPARDSTEPLPADEIEAHCSLCPRLSLGARRRNQHAGPPALEPQGPADGQPALGHGPGEVPWVHRGRVGRDLRPHGEGIQGP